MEVDRQEEILSFFAKGDMYNGPKLKDMDFSKAELSELRDAEYIICAALKPLRYKITIKGARHLKKLKKQLKH